MVCCDKVVIFALLAKAVACKARGGCKEDDWPTTEQEFQEMLQESGYSCVGIQVGGAKYDPSTDGRYCGWKGDAEQLGLT
eukprot:g24191.t1